MNPIILWLVITILRFGQTLAIWWFIMSFFRRKFSDHKKEFLLCSFFISLLLLSYNFVFHISDTFLIFALEWPFYILFHMLILKKGWGLAVIEATIGYYMYRITETEIAMLFNWQHIISIRKAVTDADSAILIQFILPFMVVSLFQVLLAKKNIGYYFVNNRIMPSKLNWTIWGINSVIILYFFDRILDELQMFKTGYYGLDEQPFLWGFICLNLLILWRVNQSGWEKIYNKQSISCFHRKKSNPLKIKKVGNHP